MSSSAHRHPRQLARLSVVRQRRRIAAAARSILISFAVLLASGTAAVAVEALAHFAPTGRVTLWVLVFVATLLSLVGTYLGTARHSTSMDRVASDVESAYPEFRERLIAARQFASGRVHGSQALADAVVHEAGHLLSGIDLGPLVDRKPVRRAAVFGLGAAILACGTYLAAPAALTDAAARLASPLTAFENGPALTLSVLPGDTRLAKGDTLQVAIRLDGAFPKSVTVYRRDAGAPTWYSESVGVSDSGAAEWSWPQVRDDAEYRVDAGTVASPAYRVQVVERPQVTGLQVDLRYPSYTGRPAESLPENEGNITAIAGTRTTITLEANKPAHEGYLVFGRSDSVRLHTEDRTASGAFTIRNATSYRIELADEFGYTNLNPISYRIDVIPDERPNVRITHPGIEADLDQEMRVALRAEAMDDFGFDRMELHTIDPKGAESVTALPMTTIGPGHVEARYVWDLGEMDILPEDQIRYRVVVWDNDRVTGPKRAESEEHVLRFPSVAEIFAEAQSEQREQIGRLDEIHRQGRELRERLDAIRREVLKTDDLSWESRQEAERITQQQQEMNQEVEKLASDLQRTIEQLERNDVLSQETIDKVSQIQELMRELVPPELRQALEEMRNRTQQPIDPNQLQQAMQNLGEKQDAFNQNLDRILNLLREAQADQQLDAMQRRLQELARIQQDVADRMQESDPRTSAGRERALSEQVRDMQRQIESMAEEMADLTPSPSDSLDAVASDLSEQRVAERLQQLANRISQHGESTPSDQQEALDIAEAIQQASDRMQRTAEDRRRKQSSDVAEKIERAATDLLRLSTMQEDLLHNTDGSRSREALGRIGETQVDLQMGTSGVVARVMEIAQESSAIPPRALQGLGETLRSMGEATGALEQRRGDMAAAHQRAAMGALNTTVLALREASENAQGSQGASSLEDLLQQLADMAEQQQRLNDAMHQMQGQGQLSPSEMDILAQMAAQQRAMADAMRQLAEQIQQYREILGRLGDLAAEMDESARELEAGSLGQRLQDRQQRILRRLLDAQRSLNMGKQGTERTSETSRDMFDAASPGQLPDDLGERRIYLREAMLEALQANYPPEYREWIRSYYEQLLSEQESGRPRAP